MEELVSTRNIFHFSFGIFHLPTCGKIRKRRLSCSEASAFPIQKKKCQMRNGKCLLLTALAVTTYRIRLGSVVNFTRLNDISLIVVLTVAVNVDLHDDFV